ncbi:hypothetical protein A2W15_00460 [Candidatus Woesebacteria bacterium RBG_16_41_13]|nr:MAG: hypothetical protein A2W15_00460 [Candidatus Woesebacteria bacterium RBG_16_41_13]
MFLFALFTIGYIVGVFTALWLFPPNSREIVEQEVDAMTPILNLKPKEDLKNISQEGLIYT